MQQILGTGELATNYLEEYFSDRESPRAKIGTYKNFVVDFVNCTLQIIHNDGGYFFYLYYKIGRTLHFLESDTKNTLEEIIMIIRSFYNDYTLDMEFRKIVSKKRYEERITFRNAINKLIDIEYKNCYSCSSVFVMMTPCYHSICSKCFYKSIKDNGTFTCEICKQMYAKAGSQYRICKTNDENGEYDSEDYDPNEYSEDLF